MFQKQLIRCLALTIFALFGIVGTTGCVNQIQFTGVPSYKSPHNIDGDVIVSVPKDIYRRKHRVKIGKYFDTQYYEIPEYDVFKLQLNARLGGLFNGERVLIFDDELDEVRGEKKPLDEEGEEKYRSTDDILAEYNEVNKEKKWFMGDKKRELSKEGYYSVVRQDFKEEKFDYLVEITQPFIIVDIDQRVKVAFKVDFIDWRTKASLFKEPRVYSGSSTRIEPLPSEIEVPHGAAGMRLDTWLSRLPGAPSRNRVQQLLKDEKIIVNGRNPKAKYELRGGEKIVIDWPPPDDDWPWPQDIPLDIVHDDEEVVVINKQPGLIVHPSPGHPDGTVVNALLHIYPDLPGINGVKRPGIVHRLDRDTTGLMVVAKTGRAMKSLAKQLANRTASRNYLAVVLGDPKWETIRVEADIGRDPVNRLKRAIDGGFPRHAVSHFTVLRRSPQFALIGCKLETARTHQIRIHVKHIGHPIICDKVYDGSLARCVERLTPKQHELKRLLSHYDRPWLHAHTLEFTHPGTGKQVCFKVPPPEDSQKILKHIFEGDIDAICGEREVKLDE